MDIIYKITDVLLYDNQLDHNYFILYNKRKSFNGDDLSELPYDFTLAFREIYKDKLNFKKSLELIEKASIKSNITLIKNNNFLTLKKVSDTHLSNYNGYDIYWNETKSGINIFDYDICGVWDGGSQYSSYSIHYYKNERKKYLRKSNLNNLLILS